MNDTPVKKWILPAIVVAQFSCTSLWFAGNAIMPDIIKKFTQDESFLANLTSAVQFGFITGTFIFALFTIADRFSPSVVFFSCSVIAALFNLGIIINGIPTSALLLFRFFTGFFLAGIYPVGMKIASDYFQKGLGRSLGFLVGALVLGTAFPHLLKSITTQLPWKYVIYSISTLSVMGGCIILFLVPDGPFRKKSQQLNFAAFRNGFSNKNFRSAAVGYFGHMWELYTFWAFVPVILATNKNYYHNDINVPLFSFLIIACGSVACVASGLLSQKFGAKKIATLALFLSCSCCLLSPLFILSNSTPLLLSFLFFWGLMVIADSPLFSTLVAQNVAEESRGTSLTIVNCIGFSITIISIQLLKILSANINAQYLYLVLAVGPVIGLIALLRNKK
ncbi:MFS transporter [Ferruginibacter sp. SUN106]|uniref:MFS transporter n=1 Tax=Ferruginibacter sp. SUN106 TaxID=2978348 RepID=UPI003D35D68F